MHSFRAPRISFAGSVLTTRQSLSKLCGYSFNRCERSASLSHTVNVNTTTTKPLPKVIFILGGPGCGKGTQCDKISSSFGITHLSAGELLRQEQYKKSEIGLAIDKFMKEGSIVPSRITLDLLQKAINQQKSWYLIDGFPRNRDNLEEWEHNMKSTCDVELVIYLECDDSELRRRLENRGRSSGRDDDNRQAIQKRITVFHRDTIPVMDYLADAKNGYKLYRINANRDVESVFKDISVLVSNVMSCARA